MFMCLWCHFTELRVKLKISNISLCHSYIKITQASEISLKKKKICKLHDTAHNTHANQKSALSDTIAQINNYMMLT